MQPQAFSFSMIARRRVNTAIYGPAQGVSNAAVQALLSPPATAEARAAAAEAAAWRSSDPRAALARNPAACATAIARPPEAMQPCSRSSQNGGGMQRGDGTGQVAPTSAQSGGAVSVGGERPAADSGHRAPGHGRAPPAAEHGGGRPQFVEPAGKSSRDPSAAPPESKLRRGAAASASSAAGAAGARRGPRPAGVIVDGSGSDSEDDIPNEFAQFPDPSGLAVPSTAAAAASSAPTAWGAPKRPSAESAREASGRGAGPSGRLPRQPIRSLSSMALSRPVPGENALDSHLLTFCPFLRSCAVPSPGALSTFVRKPQAAA